MLRCGILLPRSSLFPSFGLDVLNGIKACLRHAGCHNDVSFITDNIGFGIDESEIYTKAEKMLLMEAADVVIVVADYKVAEMLEPLFAASNKLLLMVHLGANVPDKWEPAATTITHTLNFCFLANLTGKLAALESENKKGAYAISYYDTGYRQCYYLLNSHQNEGGIPSLIHVTTLHRNEFSLAPIAEKLETEPDINSLLCLCTGDAATDFYNSILPIQNQFGFTIYAGPMMLDKLVKEHTTTPLAIRNTKGFACWHQDLKIEENNHFKTAFKEIAGKAANMLAVLGWDTGTLLLGIIGQYENDNKTALSVIKALINSSFESPRGWMKLDAATQQTYGPAWLVSCEGDMELEIVNDQVDIEEEWKLFSKEPFPAETSSGWRNTYLCI
jgi:branched-chain amino acid transport system substrate-binding protein